MCSVQRQEGTTKGIRREFELAVDGLPWNWKNEALTLYENEFIWSASKRRVGYGYRVKPWELHSVCCAAVDRNEKSCQRLDSEAPTRSLPSSVGRDACGSDFPKPYAPLDIPTLPSFDATHGAMRRQGSRLPASMSPPSIS